MENLCWFHFYLIEIPLSLLKPVFTLSEVKERQKSNCSKYDMSFIIKHFHIKTR